MFPRAVATREVGKVFRMVTGTSGRLLALAMDTLDGEVQLCDALLLGPRGKLFLGAMRTVRACALSSNDSLLVVATHEDISAFDLATQRSRWTAPLHGDETALALSPTDARVAVGRAAGGFSILRLADGSRVASVDAPTEPRTLLWDVDGVVSLESHRMTLFDAHGAPRLTIDEPLAGGELQDATILGSNEGFATIGTTPRGVIVQLCDRRSPATHTELCLHEDEHVEGVAFAGGVLFVATEAGVYRADAPFDQLTRWLPPLGGSHDPTRIAAVADSHLAVSARDLRLFRTRS